MFSRAHLLIKREFEKLKAEKPWGIEAQPLREDNIFEWVAKMRGLKDTPWEDGVFRVYMRFDENYNVRPPQVCFHTVPFHPNNLKGIKEKTISRYGNEDRNPSLAVEMITGRPCLEFLDDFSKWEEGYTISTVLLAIQWLLSNPSYEEAVNLEALEMLQHSPHTYQQVVHECVVASRRMEDGMQIQMEQDSKVKFKQPAGERSTGNQPTGTHPTHISKLSFDDYHMTWCGIATSKSQYGKKNPLLESMRGRPLLQQVHMGLPLEEIQDQLKKQMQEHSALMYGRFGTRPTAEEEKVAKLNRLERMKRIYLPPRVSPTPAPDIMLDSSELPDLGSKDEPWEKEVDDLLVWTANLDPTAIDT